MGVLSVALSETSSFLTSVTCCVRPALVKSAWLCVTVLSSSILLDGPCDSGDHSIEIGLLP